MDQDRAFVQGESDRYWRRNREAIARLDIQHDIPLKLATMYEDIGRDTALEIGAANGYRLAWLHDRFGTQGTAVEPSAEAIADGQARYPPVRYVRATAADMELNESFDLVIVNYVLHWVDRRCLLQSVANIDKAVKDGGYLIVGDFAPANRYQVPYHHHSGMYTYKQDYARLFLETGLYHVVAMLTTGHSATRLEPNVPEQERYGVTLLRKDTSAHYVEVSLLKGAVSE